MSNMRNTDKLSQPTRVAIREGDIVLPYQSGYPIMLFDNVTDGKQQDPFIRARTTPDGHCWYSDVDVASQCNESTPRDPQHTKSSGIVVFISTESIPTGYGVSITRVFHSGGSARGVLVPLPKGVEYPFDTAFKKLPNSNQN